MSRRKLKPAVLFGLVGIVGVIVIGGTIFFLTKKKAPVEEEKTVQANAPKKLTLEELQGGNYYIMDKDRNFYEMPNGLFINSGNQDWIANSPEPDKRIIMFGQDDATIPTLYSDGAIIYKAPDIDSAQESVSLPSDITLERFKDEGWSIGIHGLYVDEKPASEGGTYGISKKYHVQSTSDTFYPGSSLSTANTYVGDQITIDKVGGVPLTEQNVSSGGTVTGLQKGKTYAVDMYDGSDYVGMDAVADTHMLTSYEVTYTDDYSMSKDNYLVIPMPDDLWSGYYIANGTGVFKYIRGKQGHVSENIDLNTPYFVGTDEDGNTIKNPANGTATSSTTESAAQADGNTKDEQTWSYTTSIDNPQKSMDMTVVFSDPASSGDDENVSPAMPSAELIGPDGTRYDFSYSSTADHQLTVHVDNPGTGTWEVKMKGMKNRTFNVGTSFAGNAANMIVKDGNQAVEMPVYVDKDLTDGVFIFTWDDTDHAADISFTDGKGNQYGNKTAPDTVLKEAYGEIQLHVGALTAGDYKVTIKGESLGTVRFSYTEANASQETTSTDSTSAN
jgi:hypothetical protein